MDIEVQLAWKEGRCRYGEGTRRDAGTVGCLGSVVTNKPAYASLKKKGDVVDLVLECVPIVGFNITLLSDYPLAKHQTT